MSGLSGRTSMITFVRRFLVLAALMFWQGGFTFYAAVVVPVGQHVLKSHMKQGFITREVTNYLNLAGLVALAPLTWDVPTTRDSSSRRRCARYACLALMALFWIVLVTLHRYLDGQLDLELRTFRNQELFDRGHRWYLWISTFQWAAALVYIGLTLAAWRAADRARNDSEKVSA
ncbi:MAG: hypothetical protein C5B58_02350 [Acidobacteria bacterium]|nr:MAG: hypothetical protein C5B58_02350 [Acidobacteriota bacterium]